MVQLKDLKLQPAPHVLASTGFQKDAPEVGSLHMAVQHGFAADIEVLTPKCSTDQGLRGLVP